MKGDRLMDTVIDSMTNGVAGLTSVFSTLFLEAMDLVTGNWLLLLIIGVPIVGGIMFAVISWVKARSGG